METDLVIFKKEDNLATITLNSPPLNILSADMMGAISHALENVASDSSLKALLVNARGKAFSAGADVGEHHPDKASDMIGAFSRMFRLFGELEIPMVMAVEGAALGAGFELAMMADILIASEKASFGQPEIRLGFFAPLGVAYLSKLVGTQRAMEITCSGRTYSAEMMQKMGLVGEVVKAEEIEGIVDSILSDFKKASPLVMRLNVRTLKKLRDVPFEQARLEAEKVFLEELMATDDVLEGIDSFYEKRKPVWKNS
jgi:cyclohexa-1,5-dienecarbonyl-CoA hydratase